MPLAVQDALRRGRPTEAAQRLREANPGLDMRQARTAIAEVARRPPGVMDSGSDPVGHDTLPSEVAAKLATGNTEDAARRLRDTQPGLSEEEAREAVERHASPLLRQQARTETVVHGDSGRMGWAGWLLGLLVVAGALMVWQGIG
ncbi:hypothetical protein CO641_10130 [Lysobacteraceae bacterium NML91-0213]|nr:hypothetical protein CO641_10130 [Xanthomonadaceae bacterium NML91-0213]